MNDFIKLWLDGLSKRGSCLIDERLTVSGRFEAYLVHAIQRVEIELVVEPAPQFEVVEAAPQTEDLRRNGYLEWAIFGILDVLMLGELEPVYKLRIILRNADYDPIDCFRWPFVSLEEMRGEESSRA